jgi:hypothetical protein
MNTHKNNGKTLWALPALSLLALCLTAGTGCDPQGTDSQTALEAAMNPSATMARFISPPFGTRLGFGDTMSRLVNPVIEARLEKADSILTARIVNPVIEARLESADTAGISMLR